MLRAFLSPAGALSSGVLAMLVLVLPWILCSLNGVQAT